MKFAPFAAKFAINNLTCKFNRICIFKFCGHSFACKFYVLQLRPLRYLNFNLQTLHNIL